MPTAQGLYPTFRLIEVSLVPEPLVKDSCDAEGNNASEGQEAYCHGKPDCGISPALDGQWLIARQVGLSTGDDLRGGDGLSLSGRIHTSSSPVVALFEVNAGADLTQTGDAVKVVGGHGLVLLLQEAEGMEGKASMLAVSVLDHGGKLVPGTRHKQVEEAGVVGELGDGSIASVKEDVVLVRQVGCLDLDVDGCPQLNPIFWHVQGSGIVFVTEQLHGQCADETPIVVPHCDGGSRHINLGIVDQVL